MTTRARNGKDRKAIRTERRTFRMAPMARAIALTLAAGSMVGVAHAQRTLSPAWFASKGAAQNIALQTGKLSNGMPASSLGSHAAPINANVARSINNLNLAARGIAAQQAAQAAAREATLNAGSSVPDGLVDGGLKVDTHSLTAGWINANGPVQTAAGGKTEVKIEQTAEKAILNWETFNVGKNTTVNFDQSKGTRAKDGSNTWIALNRINDPSGKPSEIAGQIKADGSVYLINRNGIVFAGSSQINTRTLVASSLKLSDEQFKLGINNPQKFANGGNDFPIPQFGEFTSLTPDIYYAEAAFKPGNGTTPDQLGSVDRFEPGLPPGAVTVVAGAQLEVRSGGKLMLFAPKVNNAGHLSAPDGQVILAAGENVYLKSPQGNDTNGVRGLDVAVSAVPGWAFTGGQMVGALGLDRAWADASFVEGIRTVVLPEMAARAKAVGYEVVNTGSVRADRGNVTLQAQDIRQNGVLMATTALNNRNGSILLRAWGLGTHMYADGVDDLMNWSAGTLTLGAGSLIQILPDTTDTSEIESTALATRYRPGRVELYGQLIDIQPRAGVLVPSGTISMESAVNPLFTQQAWRKGSLGDASRIYLDRDAFLSVAGLQDMQVAMSRNFVEAELRINELRDSPLQLDSWLRGKKVIVDRRANGVFEKGPMAGVQWVQKRDANGVVVTMPGEWVGTPLADVAGWVGVGKTDLNELSADAGSITLRAGGAVITRAGSVIDVSGGSVRYSDGLNTATKLRGADGRTYAMDKALPDMVYTGLAGRYVVNHARWGVEETYQNPLIGGHQRETGYTEGRSAGEVKIFAGDAMVLEGDFRGNVVVGDRQLRNPTSNKGGLLQLGEGSPDQKPWSPGTIIVSHDPKRLDEAFNAATRLSDEFYVPLDPDPEKQKSLKLTWLSDNMLSRSGMGEIVFNTIRGDFELTSGASLDLSPGASLYIGGNEGSGGDLRIHGLIRAAGGSINLDSRNGELILGTDGRLDVSGQWVNAWRDGLPTGPWAMDGGSIGLNVGQWRAAPEAYLDVSGGGRVDIGRNGLPVLRVGDAGAITLAGISPGMALASLNLRAHAAGSAGSLVLQTGSSVQIGGALADADADVVLLPASLYGELGFGRVSVSVGDEGRIVVPEDVTVSQLASSIDLTNFDFRNLATGKSLAGAAPIGILRPEQRLVRKATSLHLGSSGSSIDIGKGAVVRTDTGGQLHFAAGKDSALTVHGTLEAAAGRIELEANVLNIASDAQLLARGVPVIHLNSSRRRVGSVLDGGTVSLRGRNIWLESGALIDVSGATGEIDGTPYGMFDRKDPQAITLDSNGGLIRISGKGLIEGTLVGAAGGPGASGGKIEFDMLAPSGAGGTPLERLQQALQSMDPDCYGLAGNGACDNSNWKEALDFDWSPLIGGTTAFIIPSSLLGHLDDSKELVLSDTMPAPAADAVPLDPARFGLTPESLDFFRDNLLYTELLREILQTPGQAHALTVRPQSFQAGGFADLSLVNSSQGAIRLDNAHIAMGRSISLQGEIKGNQGATSSLHAPYIALSANSNVSLSPAPGSAESSGQLTLRGSLIDIANENETGVVMTGAVRITGFASTLLEADEIRFGSALPTQFNSDTLLQAHLDVDGKLVLKAGQIYPAMAMKAIIRAGDSIHVDRFGVAGVAPLSAGGTLRLEAPVIEQNGVLRAPFGQIELIAGERLTLGAGSITSVSGAGLVVPYGTLTNNEHWHDPTQPLDDAAPAKGSLTAPPEKRITLTSPDVALDKGAVVDITGGGDLYAWEFVPGPGGSHDVLNLPGMYAVLPSRNGAAPASGIEAGQRVWLAGGKGLAAGWYALLPARYALLPGAFAVQATGKDWAGAARAGVVVADGSLIMQGKGGNALGNTQDAIASAWRVMPGATLRKYSEYNEAFANDFFSSDAFKLTQYRLTGQNVVTPRLARDGGAVVFDATQRLILDGTLLSQADKGGRGGLVDIASKKIAIVGGGQDAGTLQADGYLIIDATSLSNFGAGSLLIGGIRKGDPLGLQLHVTASDIVVRNDAGSQLYGPEILLAASEQVAIEAGSVVSAKGAGSSNAGDLVMKPQLAAVYTDPDGQLDDNWDGVVDAQDAKDDVLTAPARDWGALVRVANGDAVKVLRENVDTTRGGLVRIGAGAIINGGAALLIDATRTTELAGSARISGTDLSVAAGRIGLGGGTEGMVLDTGALAQLANSKRLTLRSYSSFDFYESLDLGAAGLASLAFDGAAFVGHGAGAVVLKGDTITLLNSGGNASVTGIGSGSFTLDAGTLVLGAGQKRFSGFNAVTLTGSRQIVGEDAGGIHVGNAALTLNTPLLTGRGGATQSFVTEGALRVAALSGGASTPQDLQDSLGSRLALTGGSIQFGGHAVALGGSIDLTATDGSLALAEGARIDVGGFAKQFFDVSEYADAGRINLSAIGGDVHLGRDSMLNLAAHQDGGSAGTLSVAASNGGTVILEGTIAARAGNGGKAGAFSLDIEALPNFAAFSHRLNEAGFDRSRQFRIRQGNVLLDGTTTVDDFALTTDQGSIDITGTIDARSGFGGAIRITGGNGVSMQQGAQLLAGAMGELGSGRVTLEAAGGQLDLQGGQIDVAGNEGGKVRLRARQTAGHDGIHATALKVNITGARSAVLEGVSTYDVADYDGRTVDSVKADAIADAHRFNAAAFGMASRLGTHLAILAGIEIQSAGDLAMNSDWNLFSDFSGHREGTLTLRAGGNLLINGHLSDGFDQADRSGVLQNTASWNLRLVAGADLASAHTLALKPLAAQVAGQGNLIVGTANTAVPSEGDPTPDNGAGKLIRTGTGDLEVRAGRDLTLAHKESVIYTAGRKDTTTWNDFTTANPAATYGIDGGHLDINAQGSIEAQHSGQRFTQWLNRQGNLNDQRYFGAYENGESGWRPDGSYGPLLRPSEQSSWWINYGAFQQGVGALGGGNVTVNAGGDLGNLLVALTSNMRMRGGRSATEAMAMETRNGGAMTVEAGGAIRGGQYYVARGAGTIRAGETTTGHSVNVDWDDSSGTIRRSSYTVAPVLALGDATLSLSTAGDLRLQTVVDPLLVRYGDGLTANGQILDHGAYMSGYTDRSALKLLSTGGDITFDNRAEFIFSDRELRTNDRDTLVGHGGNRYPARLSVAALNGDLAIDGPLYVLPGSTNDVRLVAQNDMRFAAPVLMAYATPAMMPSAFMPTGGGGYEVGQMDLEPLLENWIWNGPSSHIKDAYLRSVHNPDVLPLAGDFEPSRFYTAKGSILGLDLRASEQTWVRAGTDIRGIRLQGRNLRASDVTLLEAGNDILAMTPVAPINPESAVSRSLTGDIAMQGPGTLAVSAGRDVYADDLSIQTLGNRRHDNNNRPVADSDIKGLPEQGASITVMAGMNQAAGYEAFASAYLDPAQVASMPDYLKSTGSDGTVLPIYLTDLVETRKDDQQKTVRRGLVSYMQDMTGEKLEPLQAWARFQELPALAQRQFLRQVYLLELREAGRDQNQPGTGGLPRNGGYNRGYAAIATLFPGDAWKGDVAANKLMLRTMAGGDVSVLTPGGGLQLAALGSSVPAGYGLVTLASGHINVFAREDVVVNRSRILSFVPEATRQGSDQIIWSTKGDIDAGRGSKTVRVPAAPEVLTDLDGFTSVLEKSDMSGSGIGTVGDGDVDLVAPEGTINAGDAGIRFAGNLNLAALHIVNADNIAGEGEITGLPAVVSVNIGALTAASAAASQASAAAQEAVQRERAAARGNLPSVFTVKVLGFGNEPIGRGEQAPPPKAGLQSDATRYREASPVQIVGLGGTLDSRHAARLTSEERRLLQQDR
ncbi:filamentous haemagglutinin family protein [Variovorax sp. LT1R16]|uniref:filamentous haemagglutinin family protein n=1 Tax=Variovorax sp. LT1R16 TaxID=3443728 RepID=UPI003F480606